jgi:predicted dehydrogenase
MRQLRLAIIGQGRSGRNIHGQYLLINTERFKIVYVVDAIEERRHRAAAEYGCSVFADYHELFGRKDIDLVVNASLSYQHPPITIDLLEHGFNVLCEKPLAQTTAQVDSMITAAKKTGKMLAIFQQSRFAPYFEQVKKVIASGVLGRLVQISVRFNEYFRRWDWQTLQEFGGGSLYNTGPHPVDQVLNLLDYPDMPTVFCKMDRVNTFGDADNYVKLILTAPEKPLIDVEISSCDAYPSFTYNIQGSTGGLMGRMTDIHWRWFVPSEVPEQKLLKNPLRDEEGLPIYCQETLTWHEDSWKVDDAAVFTYATGKLYDTIYDHLTKGTPLAVTPEQVRQQIQVMEEAHRQNPLSRLK